MEILINHKIETQINNLEEAYKSSKDLEAFKNDLKMYYDDIVEHKIAQKAYLSDKIIYCYCEYAYDLRENLMCAYYLSSFDELRPIYMEYIIDLDSKFSESLDDYTFNYFKEYIHSGDLYEDANEEYSEVVENIRHDNEFDFSSGCYIHVNKWTLQAKWRYLCDYIDHIENATA